MATMTITIIVTEVVAARFCPLTKRARVGQLIIYLIQVVFTILAIVALPLFYHRMWASLKGRRVLGKLIALTLLVIVIIIQTVVFTIVDTAAESVIRPRLLTYYDVVKGAPNIIYSLVSVLFSFLFLWAYSPSAYRHMLPEDPRQTGSGSPRNKGVRKGLLDTMSPLDPLLQLALPSICNMYCTRFPYSDVWKA